MAQKMMEYIYEQPRVWKEITDCRSLLCGGLIKSIQSSQVKRVVLLGSGSSFIAAQMAGELFIDMLGIEATPVEPTRLGKLGSLLSTEETLFVAISQSGRSTSTLQVIEELHREGKTVVGVTSDSASPIAVACDSHVLISCGEETVGPKTKGMTATVLTLYLLGLELAVKTGRLQQPVYDEFITSLSLAFSYFDENAANSLKWINENAASLAAMPQLTVISDGLGYPVAKEGALKILETLYIPVFAYEFEEYLHGINNTINAGAFNLFLMGDTHNRERMLRLVDYCAGHGCHGFVISDSLEAAPALALPIHSSGSPFTAPFEALLPFQLMSAVISEQKGIECDRPRFADFYAKMGTKVQG